MRSRRTALLFLCLLAPLAGRALPTGLPNMPTAEVLGVGRVRVDLQLGHSTTLFTADARPLMGVQVGVLPNVEAGIDASRGESVALNLKWRSRVVNPENPTVAVGVQQLAHGEHPQWYLVATKPIISDEIIFGPSRHPYETTRDEDLAAVKVHGGLLYGETKRPALLAGADVKFGRVLAQSDVVIGSRYQRFSLGVGALVTPDTLVAVTGNFRHNAPDTLTLTFSYQSPESHNIDGPITTHD